MNKELKDREKFLLRMVVEEYINEGEPISSKFLVEKYNFNLSPATIRFELQRLTQEGYLYQPHTSAGRVPTDRGYRFFIDELMEPFSLRVGEEGLIRNVFEEVEDDFDKIFFNKELIRTLAGISKDLAVVASPKEREIYYDGVLNLFQKPEFQEIRQIRGIFEIIENFKNNFEDFMENIGDFDRMARVYVGRENPFCGIEDCSLIISRFDFPQKEQKNGSGILAILGPKRMRYNKNISLLNFISNFEHAQ